MQYTQLTAAVTSIALAFASSPWHVIAQEASGDPGPFVEESWGDSEFSNEVTVTPPPEELAKAYYEALFEDLFGVVLDMNADGLEIDQRPVVNTPMYGRTLSGHTFILTLDKMFAGPHQAIPGGGAMACYFLQGEIDSGFATASVTMVGLGVLRADQSYVLTVMPYRDSASGPLEAGEGWWWRIFDGPCPEGQAIDWECYFAKREEPKIKLLYQAADEKHARDTKAEEDRHSQAMSSVGRGMSIGFWTAMAATVTTIASGGSAALVWGVYLTGHAANLGNSLNNFDHESNEHQSKLEEIDDNRYTRYWEIFVAHIMEDCCN